MIRALRGHRFVVRHVRNGAEAQDALRQDRYAIILLDHRLPDVSGIHVCKTLRQNGVTTPIVLVSSAHDDEVARRALAAGANDFLTKGMRYGTELPAYLSTLLPPS